MEMENGGIAYRLTLSNASLFGMENAGGGESLANANDVN
jgi:hypothetical protein